MESTTLRLPYSGTYDWPATLRFLAARAVDGVEQVDAALYRRTIRLANLIGTLEVAVDPDGAALRVTVTLPSRADERTAVARLRRMFDLDADLPAITSHLATDPAMASLVTARPALRVFGGWDGFEVAVRTINGQQVSVERARHLNAVLIARCGVPAPLDLTGGLRGIFPTPQEVLAADLSDMGMPGARVLTLTAMAEAAVADPTMFEPGSSLEDTIARLRAVRGIGDWTAHYIAMRACRQPDAFPAGDVGLLRGAADAQGRRPSPADLLARAEAWRPWRAYAAHHLWAADGRESPEHPAAYAPDCAASAGVREGTAAVTVGA